MSTTLSTTPIVSIKTLEDYLPLIAVILGAVDSSQLANLIPGLPGIVVAYIVAALAKSLIGLGQNPSFKNWEDILLFASTFLGLLAGLFLGNIQLALYGTILGWLVKSLGFLQSGINVEDVLLAVSSLVVAVGAFTGNTAIVSVGALLSVLSKTLPSLGTNGLAGFGTTATTTAPAATTATAATGA